MANLTLNTVDIVQINGNNVNRLQINCQYTKMQTDRKQEYLFAFTETDQHINQKRF